MQRSAPKIRGGELDEHVDADRHVFDVHLGSLLHPLLKRREDFIRACLSTP